MKTTAMTESTAAVAISTRMARVLSRAFDILDSMNGPLGGLCVVGLAAQER